MKWLIALVLPSTLGWSADGHRIISDLTLRLIDERSLEYLKTHLEDTTFAEASVWADSDGAKRAYPGSEFSHFIDSCTIREDKG
jgi:hypothetical protein